MGLRTSGINDTSASLEVLLAGSVLAGPLRAKRSRGITTSRANNGQRNFLFHPYRGIYYCRRVIRYYSSSKSKATVRGTLLENESGRAADACNAAATERSSRCVQVLLYRVRGPSICP